MLQGDTSVIVYHEGSVLQVIEGPEKIVDELFSKIRRDPRHDFVTLLERREIKQNEFGDWSMAFVDTTGKASEIEGFVDYDRDLKELTLGHSRARTLLDKFQKGLWHQHLT